MLESGIYVLELVDNPFRGMFLHGPFPVYVPPYPPKELYSGYDKLASSLVWFE